MRIARSRDLLIVPIALALAAVSSCGSGQTDTSSAASPASDATAVPELHEALPESIKDVGVIRFAGDPHPPYRIVDADGKITGIDKDVQDALGAVLGVDTEMEPASGLPSILSGLNSGRYDAFNGPVKDTAEREERFDVVVWMTTKPSYLMPEGTDVESAADLCGRTVGVVSGSVTEGYVDALAEYCTDNGSPAVTKTGYDDTNATILALKSGRADAAGMTQSAALHAMSEEEGTYSYVTQTEEQGATTDNLGMVIPKDSGLGPVVLDAFEELFENGEYQRIMEEWGLTDVMVDEPEMNTAGDE